MVEVEVEPTPWEHGWIAGKYAATAPLPTAEELPEWLAGFKAGCAEVGEFDVWRRRLYEYLVALIRRLYAQLADLLL